MAKRQSFQPGECYCIIFAFIPAFAVAPWTIAVGCLMTDLDPTYYISEYYLPSPMYRTTHEIYTSWVIRFLIVLWLVLEYNRSNSFGLTCLIIYMNRLSRVVRYFVQSEGDPEKLIYEFNCLTLSLVSARKEFNAMAYFVLTLLFWTVVLLA